MYFDEPASKGPAKDDKTTARLLDDTQSKWTIAPDGRKILKPKTQNQTKDKDESKSETTAGTKDSPKDEASLSETAKVKELAPPQKTISDSSKNIYTFSTKLIEDIKALENKTGKKTNLVDDQAVLQRNAEFLDNLVNKIPTADTLTDEERASLLPSARLDEALSLIEEARDPITNIAQEQAPQKQPVDQPPAADNTPAPPVADPPPPVKQSNNPDQPPKDVAKSDTTAQPPQTKTPDKPAQSDTPPIPPVADPQPQVGNGNTPDLPKNVFTPPPELPKDVFTPPPELPKDVFAPPPANQPSVDVNAKPDQPPAPPPADKPSAPSSGGELAVSPETAKVLKDFPATAFDKQSAPAAAKNVTDIAIPNDAIYKLENTHVELASMKKASYKEGDVIVGFDKSGDQVLLNCNNLYLKIKDAEEIKKLGIVGKDGKPGATGWYMKEPGQNGTPDRWRKMPSENYVLDMKTGAFISQKESDHLMYFSEQRTRFDVKKNATGATVRVGVDNNTENQQFVEKVTSVPDNNNQSKLTEVKYQTSVDKGQQQRAMTGFTSDALLAAANPVDYIGDAKTGFKPNGGNDAQSLQNVKFNTNGITSFETKENQAKGEMTLVLADGKTTITAKSDRPEVQNQNVDKPQFVFDELGRMTRRIPSPSELAKGDRIRDFSYVGRSLELDKITVFGNANDASWPRDQFGQALTFVYQRQGDAETWSKAAYGQRAVTNQYGQTVRELAWFNDQNNNAWGQPAKGKRTLSLTGDYSCPELSVKK